LLPLEEQKRFSLENVKKRQKSVKKYFDKREKVVDEKVLLWDSAHVDKGKHTKFQKLWLGPYIITFVVGNNSCLLKYTDGRLILYTTNGSHLKHYVEPG